MEKSIKDIAQPLQINICIQGNLGLTLKHKASYNLIILTTDRCFIGHSLGGLLGSHILIEQPQLFNRYIIGSPSYWWDNKEITKRLSSKNILLTDSVKTVFTFIGGKEGVHITNWKEFDSILVNKINKNIKFHDQIFQDETHQSVVPAAFSTAVKFVYKK